MRRLSSLLMFSLIAVGHNAFAEADEDRGKIMAMVGEVKLYEHEVIDNPDILVSMPYPERKAYCQRLLDRAIEAEVLYQSARQEGLHEDEAFRRRLANARAVREQRYMQMLVSKYEGQQAELVAARNKLTIGDGEVAVYYEANQDKYRGRPKLSALKVIRIQLTALRANAVYRAWLKKTMADVTVRIDGDQLPVAVISECIDRFHGGTANGNANTSVDPLWQVILDAADLKLPAALCRFDAAAAEPYIERLGSLELHVGDKAFQFRDFSQFDLMARNISTGCPGSAMFNTIKTLILAEKARQANVAYERRDVQGDPERTLLTWILFEQANLLDPGSYEITEEEIEVYRTEHSSRFERIKKIQGGEDGVNALIVHMLKGEKIKEARKQYVQGLRDKFDVKIYEDSSVGQLEL